MKTLLNRQAAYLLILGLLALVLVAKAQSG